MSGGGAGAGSAPSSSPAVPWSHFVGIDTHRVSDLCGVSCSDAFHAKVDLSGPRSVSLMQIGDKVHHHRIDVVVRNCKRVTVGFPAASALPAADEALCKSHVEELVGGADCRVVDMPAGAPWMCVEMSWSTDGVAGAPHATLRVLSTTLRIDRVPPDAVPVLTLEPGTVMELRAPHATVLSPSAVTAVRFRHGDAGRVRFHPGWRPADVAVNATSTEARCTDGPRTLFFWGAPPGGTHRFRLSVVGPMTLLGMAVPNLRKHARGTLSGTTRYLAGGSGTGFGDPAWRTPVTGDVDVELLLEVPPLTLRLRGDFGVITIAGFSAEHALGVTLYRASVVRVVDVGKK